MTKLFCICFSLILLHLNVSAQDLPTINGDFNKGVLIINKVKFTKNSTIEDYEQVLGKAERIEKVGGKDKIFAYDKLGISLILKANTNLVQDINITFIYDGDKRVAKETYKGKLSINDQEITNQTSHDQLGKFANTDLVSAMKGMYMGKGKSMNLMVYYPEATIGQFAFNFSELK